MIEVPMPPSTFGIELRVDVGPLAGARDALEAGDHDSRLSVYLSLTMMRSPALPGSPGTTSKPSM